ncbi:tubulin polyglutamylase complex subunit 2 isoform X1 [Patella vulgata]|uniref:tubulin polyglutamylase complex subunit 2 isoform X1 n=1 Tax=Patella vulgata TaxID=6465 RepID=UPI00217FCDC2|nr:tubulin polyglutamylase complex subunit 2 isoform X1 [Patella vulgata]
MTEDSSNSAYLEKKLVIGVLKYLEKKRGVCKIELADIKPGDRHTVLSWEQRNACLLPEDLKNFYLSSNGFDLTWCVQIDNSELPVGRMHIHPITQVTKLNVTPSNSHIHPSLADLETESDDEETNGRDKPRLCGSSGIFELDDCGGFGKVCLVVKKKTVLQTSPSIESENPSDNEDEYTCSGITEPKVEIWFMDRSIRWHFVADSFCAYYRLMLMHLGLPQWQYAFTDIGLSLQTKQWFNMYAPIRLEVDLEGSYEMSSPRDHDTTSTGSQLDVNKVFKGKGDKKKQVNQTQNQAQTKKKAAVSSARSLSALPGKSASSSSQSSIKATR